MGYHQAPGKVEKGKAQGNQWKGRERRLQTEGGMKTQKGEELAKPKVVDLEMPTAGKRETRAEMERWRRRQTERVNEVGGALPAIIPHAHPTPSKSRHRGLWRPSLHLPLPRGRGGSSSAQLGRRAAVIAAEA